MAPPDSLSGSGAVEGAGQGGLEAYLSAVTPLRQCYCRSYFLRSYETK